MKWAITIILGCGVLAAVGASDSALHAGDMPSPGDDGQVRLASVSSTPEEKTEPDESFAPAESTEDLHAPEGTSILPLLNESEATAVRLLLTKGHLRAGVETYELGMRQQALAHLGHPVDVLHDSLDVWIDTPGAEPFEAARGVLVAAVRANSPSQAVRQDLAVALRVLDEAIEKQRTADRASVTFALLVTLSVLRAAVDEYDLAMAGDLIVDVVEYQDVRAFILEARDFARSRSAEFLAMNPGAYGILLAELAALEMALPPAEKFHATPAMSADLRRALVRIGLLYDSFK